MEQQFNICIPVYYLQQELQEGITIKSMHKREAKQLHLRHYSMMIKLT